MGGAVPSLLLTRQKEGSCSPPRLVGGDGGDKLKTHSRGLGSLGGASVGLQKEAKLDLEPEGPFPREHSLTAIQRACFQE